MRLRLSSASLLLTLVLVPVAVGAAAPETDLVSGGVGPLSPNDSGRFQYLILDVDVSGDGRFVVFQRTRIDPDSRHTPHRLFVRDRRSGALIRASLARNGRFADGGSPSLTADGATIAFRTSSRHIVPDTRRGQSHVVVRGLTSRRVVVADRASGRRGQLGNGIADEPALSRSGLRVAFSSDATNLGVPGRGNDRVFVRDLRTHRTILASRADGRSGRPGNGHARYPVLSEGGRLVAFASTATNLDPDDRDPAWSIYVRDLTTNRTTLVSRATGVRGTPGAGTALEPAISPDGRYVAFAYRGGSSGLHSDDPDRISDVYVRDLARHTTTLVSRASSGDKSDGSCFHPSLTRRATAVVFACKSRNLDPSDRNRTDDIFHRDLRSGVTTLISRASGADGAHGDGYSFTPAISHDGHVLAFASAAGNLDPADGDNRADVFVRTLP